MVNKFVFSINILKNSSEIIFKYIIKKLALWKKRIIIVVIFANNNLKLNGVLLYIY